MKFKLKKPKIKAKPRFPKLGYVDPKTGKTKAQFSGNNNGGKID